MNALQIPWIELAILTSLAGALLAARTADSSQARRIGLVAAGAALLAASGAWLELVLVRDTGAARPESLSEQLLATGINVVDELTAPLIALAALQYFLTILATLRAKVQRFSFATALFSLAILQATFACQAPWGIIGLLAIGTIPPLLEIVRRGRSPRVYAIHIGMFVVLLVLGQFLASAGPGHAAHSLGISLLAAAVLLRCGVVPVHCWMTDLFEKASFGTALLTVTPMVGAYAAMRLVLPTAPNWVLAVIAGLSLVTAIYASCMALVQTEARRFFCYLFLSHASLVLVGVEIATPIGLTGALCVWLSVGLSLVGFGLTLRSVETRAGRLSMTEHHGFFESTPVLAGFFLLTGLASIGFPGTIGFVAVELLVEGAVRAMPLVGAIVVLTAALNGIAVLHAYFRIFNGKTRTGTIDLRCRISERAAVLVLSILIIGGGIVPQPGVMSRYRAAEALIEKRAESLATLSKADGAVTWATKKPYHDAQQ